MKLYLKLIICVFNIIISSGNSSSINSSKIIKQPVKYRQRVKKGTTAQELNQLISSSPSNTIYQFDAGVYRLNESIVIRSGNSFVAGELDSKPIFTGSIEIPINTFTYNNTLNLYQSIILGRSFNANRHGPCSMKYPACNFSQELFINDRRIKRVDMITKIHPRAFTEWYLEYDTSTIYIGMIPSSSQKSQDVVIELSILPAMFSHNKQMNVSNIHLENIIVDKFSTPAQFGAISPSGKNWKLFKVEVKNNHGRGIDINYNAIVNASHIHHNGQLGLGGHDGMLLNSEVNHNNMAGFSHGWEAGGFKFVGYHIKVIGNHIHNNNGTGMWADIGSVGTWYENNLVENNTNAGISYEISYNGTIINNTFRGNGFERCTFGKQSWLWDGQIQIQNSRNCVIKNNTVHTSYCRSNGIVIIQQDRKCVGCPVPGQMIVINNIVEDNKIVMDDCTIPRVGAVSDFHPLAFQNNSFHNNTYYLFKTMKHDAIDWYWIDEKQINGNNLTTFQEKALEGKGSKVVNKLGNKCV